MSSIALCDPNPAVHHALVAAFAGTPVPVHHGSILDHLADAVAVPTNALGFLDQGQFGTSLLHAYGAGLQSALQHLIRTEVDDELLVGQALHISVTAPGKLRAVIAAPTKRVPMMHASTPLDVYLATRAALRLAYDRVLPIVLPGMGTGSGNLLARVAARAMRAAYDDVIDPPPFPTTWREAYERQAALMFG